MDIRFVFSVVVRMKLRQERVNLPLRGWLAVSNRVALVWPRKYKFDGK